MNPGPERDLSHDPYPWYSRLRESGACLPEPTFLGWVLPRMREVRAWLTDPRASADSIVRDIPEAERATLSRFDRLAGRWMFFKDPPEHRSFRSLLPRELPRDWRDATARWIEEAVDRFLNAHAGRGPVDVLETLAAPIASRMVGTMLLEDEADLATYVTLGRAISEAAVDPRDRAARKAGVEAIAALTSLLERTAPQGLGDDAFAQRLMLPFAGQETTTSAIATLLTGLASSRVIQERLRHEPDRIVAAIEECLRLESPVQAVTRVLREPATIGDRALGAGERLILLLGSANRDPECFPDPDHLDIDRPATGRAIPFGHGPHLCWGEAPARLALETVVGVLRRRGVTLRPGGAITWRRHNPFLRLPLVAPVRVGQDD